MIKYTCASIPAVPQTKVVSSSAHEHCYPVDVDTSSGGRLEEREGEEVVIATGRQRRAGRRQVKSEGIEESSDSGKEKEEEYEEGDFGELR